jgi:hypothetical protein
MKYIDLTGHRFWRLVASEVSHRDENGNEFWHCRCDCGSLKAINKHSLLRGATQSCGCLHKERSKAALTTHGQAALSGKSSTYKAWLWMRACCDNPQDSKEHRYGAKGIGYCRSWRRFENFQADMGDRPTACFLGRINKCRNFSPNNCRWIVPPTS